MLEQPWAVRRHLIDSQCSLNNTEGTLYVLLSLIKFICTMFPLHVSNKRENIICHSLCTDDVKKKKSQLIVSKGFSLQYITYYQCLTWRGLQMQHLYSFEIKHCIKYTYTLTWLQAFLQTAAKQQKSFMLLASSLPSNNICCGLYGNVLVFCSTCLSC